MSLRESVLNAMRSTLVTASVAGGRVYRTRREQVDTLPVVQIEQDGIETEEIVLGKADHTMDVIVTAYAKGDTPDSAPDATLAAAHAALAADLTLGLGAEVQLLPSYSVEAPRDTDYDVGGLAHRYRVYFRTAINAI